MTDQERILIFDFGSQYAQLIARRVREQSVFCQIVRHDLPAQRVRELKPTGIIFSGGPSSVYAPNAPKCDPGIFELGIPILGICYGLQLACHLLGGKVSPAMSRESMGGRMSVVASRAALSPKCRTKRSSGGAMATRSKRAACSEAIASTDTCPCRRSPTSDEADLLGLQFHPEVSHTPQGVKILQNFLRRSVVAAYWRMQSFSSIRW
ncbi:MAG: hypothetical protein U0744_17345 [Gemmataceae bacterium]